MDCGVLRSQFILLTFKRRKIMAVCQNCGNYTNAFNAAFGYTENPEEKLCSSCRRKMEKALQGNDLSDEFLRTHKDELLSQGITENGLKHLQKAIYIRQGKERQAIERDQKRKLLENSKNVIVTTGDIKQNYEIIGPVYFQVSNKGIFSNALSDLIAKYSSEIQEMKNDGMMSEARADWGFLYGEWSVGQSQFESAFYVATQELKKRAAMLGGDAVICMRQDIDLDTNAFSYFYLQMYGTAVKFID